MSVFEKVIFVGKSANCREPMAVELLKNEPLWKPIQVEARGLVVLFPEPINPKARAVLANCGIDTGSYMSSQLEASDFSPTTLILTFDEQIKNKVLKMPGAKNVYVLTDVTGDELEILDPYGKDLITYGICLETMKKSISKLADALNERAFITPDK